jgi:hypothetical protein
MKTSIEAALDLIRGKLATGGTIFGHEVEQIERALEEAVKNEKAKPVKEKK